jgi:hypothetical protein
MALPETGPSSSYSDPIYDRLDIFTQALRRHWWIYVLALLAIIALSLLSRAYLINRPNEASAAAFNRALDQREETERLSRLKELAENADADPYYRARADIELAQGKLDKEDANGAKEVAVKAVALAKTTNDVELSAAARLSQAAAEYQLGELTDALADYQGVRNTAGARYASLELEATLGAARTLEKQGKRADAATLLEPLLTRSDLGAERLLELARVRYWALKRDLASGSVAATGSQPSLAPPTGTAPSASTAPLSAPKAAPSAAPATSAPAAPPSGK